MSHKNHKTPTGKLLQLRAKLRKAAKGTSP